MNNSNPKADLNRLREIGWSLWDPIGLSASDDDWQGQPFEDEYDTYLVKTAGMLRQQRPEAEVVDYLFHIETERMGLGVGADETRLREGLQEVVRAIASDPMIWSDGYTT